MNRIITVFLACFFLAPAQAEDKPIGYLTDRVLNKGSPVYVFICPETRRRFLVFQVSNGNGGYNPAVVECSLTDADRARLNPPRPVPLQVERPAPVPDTTSIWELSQTLAPLTAAQAARGWECTHAPMEGGQRIYYLRRKNPHYVEPTDVERPK